MAKCRGKVATPTCLPRGHKASASKRPSLRAGLRWLRASWLIRASEDMRRFSKLENAPNSRQVIHTLVIFSTSINDYLVVGENTNLVITKKGGGTTSSLAHSNGHSWRYVHILHYIVSSGEGGWSHLAQIRVMRLPRWGIGLNQRPMEFCICKGHSAHRRMKPCRRSCDKRAIHEGSENHSGVRQVVVSPEIPRTTPSCTHKDSSLRLLRVGPLWCRPSRQLSQHIPLLVDPELSSTISAGTSSNTYNMANIVPEQSSRSE